MTLLRTALRHRHARVRHFAEQYTARRECSTPGDHISPHSGQRTRGASGSVINGDPLSGRNGPHTHDHRIRRPNTDQGQLNGHSASVGRQPGSKTGSQRATPTGRGTAAKPDSRSQRGRARRAHCGPSTRSPSRSACLHVTSPRHRSTATVSGAVTVTVTS